MNNDKFIVEIIVHTLPLKVKNDSVKTIKVQI